ncbi:helix-turn-helix transcriptional regulator [Cohnella soli]|uniref:AraC family transcriptional regulator n=1 Tax=Cohnella soli TaxID=425005 RepID=A0ABW0HXL5_9BACL
MRIRKTGYYPSDDHKPPEDGGIHGFYEILSIHQGRAKLQWLGQAYVVEGPAVFLLSPDTPHKLTYLEPTVRYHYVEFELADSNLFPTFPQLFQWNGMQNSLESFKPDSDLIGITLESLERLSKMYTQQKTPHVEEALACELRKLIALVRHLLERSDRLEGRTESLKATQLRLVEVIMRYMETNYQMKIELHTLSRLVHLNGSYLIRLFKSYQGKTPFEYLRELRMNAAVSYLKNSAMSVQEISECSGFANIHYFSTSFKKEFGVSPSEWRLLQ